MDVGYNNYLSMRTKTNERKRYSRRVKKDEESINSPEIDQLLSSPKAKKSKEGVEENIQNNEQDEYKECPPNFKSTLEKLKYQEDSCNAGNKYLEPEIEKPVKIQKTKRKGKPCKSATKEDIDEQHKEITTHRMKINNNGELKSNQQEMVINASSVDDKISKKILLEEVSENSQEDEYPVYTALEHAIVCDSEDGNCAFPKCSIAKQFLLHCETCPKKENCTICKAMDIMVCKHAENCETPLEKCCPIPNCDRVRYMVLEEWMKLKHRHHDVMTQVFQGLLHAWKCSDPSCDLILCENIKTVLLHTRSCSKDEKSCRTKKFIVQLCEYHQQTCIDPQCTVEFCQENRKRKEEVSGDSKNNVSIQFKQWPYILSRLIFFHQVSTIKWLGLCIISASYL